MAEGKSLSQRFEDYHPSKTVLFWSCAGCIVATMIVGFTWAGWVTGGSAKEMVTDAADQARAEVAAAICVRAKLVEAAGAIVQAIEKEDGRSRKDLDDALQALVGVRFYGDSALAKKWWSENQAAVAEKAKTPDFLLDTPARISA